MEPRCLEDGRRFLSENFFQKKWMWNMRSPDLLVRASLKNLIVLLFLATLFLCAAGTTEETPAFIDDLLSMRAQDEKPETPAETMAMHAQAFVEALEYGADRSNTWDVDEYHLAALDALKFLVVHMDDAERSLPPDLEEALTRVALYPGSSQRIELVYEVFDEVSTLNDTTVTFLMEQAISERKHLAIWRTIARHAKSNDRLFSFYKDTYCNKESTEQGKIAVIVLPLMVRPDETLLKCVLDNSNTPLMNKVKYLIEHTTDGAPMRATLKSRLLDVVANKSLDETSRGYAFSALWRHFEGPEALHVTEVILRSPDNPEFLLTGAIRQAKHEGLNKIPDIEVLLEEIVAKSSEGARKEAAAALEWLR